MARSIANSAPENRSACTRGEERKPATARVARQWLEDDVQAALTWLKGHSTKAIRDGMARYAIPSGHALGVAMRDIKALGKMLGHNHELAVALWDTGVYEARILTSFVGDPAQLTPAQTDRWCKDFDNWAFCDALRLQPVRPHAARLGKGHAVEQ